MDNKLTRTIIALEQDGLETRVLVLNFLVPSREFDLRVAISAAATEFCQSEAGRKVYVGNCNCFNWGDFDTYVPAELCKKHGFIKIEAEIADEVVVFDEQLVDEGVIACEDDDTPNLRYVFPPIEGRHFIWNYTVQWLTSGECEENCRVTTGLIIHESMDAALQDERILKTEVDKNAGEH